MMEIAQSVIFFFPPICPGLSRFRKGLDPHLLKDSPHHLHSRVLGCNLAIHAQWLLQDLAHGVCLDEWVVLGQIPVHLLHLILQLLDLSLQSLGKATQDLWAKNCYNTFTKSSWEGYPYLPSVNALVCKWEKNVQKMIKKVNYILSKKWVNG